MKLRDDQILVPAHDHSYRVATVGVQKVVYNQKAKCYFEYAGDEYLEDGEVVVEAKVADG